MPKQQKKKKRKVSPPEDTKSATSATLGGGNSIASLPPPLEVAPQVVPEYLASLIPDEALKPGKQFKKIFFTLHNYSATDATNILRFFKPKKYIIGFEVCPTTGRKHLQGYLDFKRGVRWETIRKQFKDMRFWKVYGNVKQNYDYCSKEGDFITNITEEDWLTFQEILNKKILEEEYKDVVWKEFQEKVIKILNGPKSQRNIYWFWESLGNVGKSYLTKWLGITRKGVIIAKGKTTDVFNQVAKMIENKEMPEIIIVDIPRKFMDFVNMGMIEELQNGFFYSGKYEGGKCAFPRPHVICFANRAPDLTEVSDDHWVIEEISV